MASVGGGIKAGLTDRDVRTVDSNDSVSRLFQEYYPSLLAFLKNRTNQDEELAQEVAQETFATLTRHLSAGKTVSHPRGLIFQIAKTKLIDHHRHSCARMQADHCDIDDYHLVSAEPDQERLVENSRKMAELEHQVLRLPPKCREVLVLKIFEDMSNQEIAQRCGISVSMVEKHASKALKIIRTEVGD